MLGASHNYSLVKMNRSRLQAKLQSLQSDSLLPHSLFMGLVRRRDWGVYREASSARAVVLGEWKAQSLGLCCFETILTPPPAPPSPKFPSKAKVKNGQRNQLKLLFRSFHQSILCQVHAHGLCAVVFHGYRHHHPYRNNQGSVLN